MARSARLPALIVFLGLCTGAGSSARQTAVAPAGGIPETAVDFPPSDQAIWNEQRHGLLSKLATERLKQGADTADTVRLLLELERFDDVLQVLSRIVRTQPGRMADGFAAVTTNSSSWLDDRSKDYASRLRELAVSARARIGELPREEAARLERLLLNFDIQVNRGQGPSYEDRLSSFAAQYRGTAEASRAEVALLESGTRDFPRKIEVLDAFARAHPGTVAGAMALYEEGFQLDANALETSIEPRGADPTARFLRVASLAAELESGAWPPCEWVERAPSLVIRFYIPQFDGPPKYSPENLDRMIGVYERFIATHFAVDDRPFGYAVGYLIADRMAGLYRLKGDVGGVERLLETLEHTVSDRAAAQYLRALYYSGPAIEASSASRASLVRKSNDMLRDLSRGDGVYPRKALATLATQQFYEGDYGSAATTFQSYLTRYPQSPWAWVAALRIGQAQQESRDTKAAVVSFRRAAATYASLPLARVLAFALAARASEALGQFADALVDRQHALSAWDGGYGTDHWNGTEYVFDTRHASPAGESVNSTVAVTKDDLVDRIATLTRTLRLPGGAALERGRWLVQQRRWDDARTALEQLIVTNPKAAVVVDARVLAHEARLQRALMLGDIGDPAHDQAAASAAFESLAREPFDFHVAAAAIARAALLWTQGASGQAQALMKDALGRWRRQQPASAAPAKNSLQADVVAIRDVVFRPMGGGIYGTYSWNGFTWPTAPAPFVVVNPVQLVKLASGETLHLTSYRPFPRLDNVLFLNADQLQFFTTMIERLGGTRQRPSTGVMETPNQPIGPSMDILALLNQCFAARPGHWGGWVFETYPAVHRIEFLNAERTRASAAVTIGYAGATVVLEKKNGVWIATGLTNAWIT
jgi:tetratricopeptide (TPR) repeat protein